jgi:tetratricopeptide (TPR) repeat protein
MEAYLKLADHYASQGNHELALRQYQALINSLPYNINYYIASGKALLKHRRFNEALPILFNSLKVKQTGYANKWIGQILLQRQQPAQAKPFLEKALSFQPDDLQVIYSLGIVNVAEDNIEGAKQSLKLVESIDPDSGQAASLKENISMLKERLANKENKKNAEKAID